MAQTLDSQGNVVQNGFSTNQTPAQFASANIPTAISASSLATPQSPIPVTQPNYNISGLTSQAAQAGAYTNNAATTAQQQAEAFAKQQEQASRDSLTQANSTLGALQASSGSKGADIASAYNQAGTGGQSVNTLADRLRQLNAQSTALGYENTIIPSQLQNQVAGQGVTDRGLAPLQAGAIRNNLIQQATIAMQSAIVSADYESAKNYADQIVEAKYSQKLADIEAAKTNLENLKENLTAAEKKTAQATLERLNKDKKDEEQKMQNDKDISKLIIDASPVAPPDILARAKAIQAKGGTATDVAMALGQYGGDYLKNELLKEQIKQTIANTNKIKSETVKVDTQTSLLTSQPTGVITAPNGDAIGLPNSTLSAIGKLKLNEGQANAVAFTSRMIQSAQAIDKQLGEINPTGGFYETTGYDPTSAGSAIGRFVGSDKSRVYNINSQDFIRAKLRKESGATISPEEMSADSAIYTPSGAGLDEKDLLLAKTKRDEAIKSMIAQAGPAAPYLQQYYEQSKTQGDVFVSANPQLNTWYQNTSGAVQTSTAQAATAGGTYGFIDNQK